VKAIEITTKPAVNSSSISIIVVCLASRGIKGWSGFGHCSTPAHSGAVHILPLQPVVLASCVVSPAYHLHTTCRTMYLTRGVNKPPLLAL
jgi:hypothetical protein